MDWERFRNWCDSLNTDEVPVTKLLNKFDFPQYRLGGYVNGSGTPTVSVSHLRDVADRYGYADGTGHGGPSEASGDATKFLMDHSTVSVGEREYEGSMGVEAEEDETGTTGLKETIKKINAIHGSDTAE